MKKATLILKFITFSAVIVFCYASCKYGAKKGMLEVSEQDSIIAESGLEPFLMTMNPNIYPLLTQKVYGYISNNTMNDAHFGEDNYLEYYEDSCWHRVWFETDTPIGINAVAYGLSANKSNDFNVYLYNEYYNYKPRKYRVHKDITTVLTAEFSIIDTIPSNVDIIKPHSEGDFVMTIYPTICSLSTDSVVISITNNSQINLAPYNHYYIEYYNGDYWERYFYPSYSKYYWTTNLLIPTSTHDYKIPLFATQFRKDADIKGFKTGKYRLCKYATISLTAEFQISPNT